MCKGQIKIDKKEIQIDILETGFQHLVADTLFDDFLYIGVSTT